MLVRVTSRFVAALDAVLRYPGPQQPGGHLPQPGRVMADGEAL
jgi:hypothetical protein